MKTVIVVAKEFRKSDQMRSALISAFVRLTFAARGCIRLGDQIGARKYAESARELAAVFGQKVKI